MKASGCGIWLLMVFILLALPSNSACSEISLNPALGIAGLYDDNVVFTETDPEADFASVINPSLSFVYPTEQTSMTVSGDVQFVNYLEQTEYDTTKQQYILDLDSRITERLRFNAGLEYILDTLLDSELDETGRVIKAEQEERERFNAKAGTLYGLSTKSNVGLDYEFSMIDYEEGFRADRTEHSVGGSYSLIFNDGLDRITLQPKYSRKESTKESTKGSPEKNGYDTEVDSYMLYIGWTRQSSEVGTIKLFGGARYTEETRIPEDESKEIEETDNTGFVADLSYTLRDEISLIRIGYRRDNGYDANNDLRELDRISGRYEWALTERLKANVEARFFASRSEGESGNDSRFFDATTWFDFQLTENHSLTLTYRYSQESNEAETEGSIRRNQVYLALTLQFPKKF
jgi:hypothetical protein